MPRVCDGAKWKVPAFHGTHSEYLAQPLGERALLLEDQALPHLSALSGIADP